MDEVFADRAEMISIDGIPIIDYLPGAENMLVGVGWSGHGWAIAPAVGEADDGVGCSAGSGRGCCGRSGMGGFSSDCRGTEDTEILKGRFAQTPAFIVAFRKRLCRSPATPQLSRCQRLICRTDC